MKPPAADAPPGPQVQVVLGATGDLARRKLVPALYRLRQLDLLPRPFRIICSGRSAPDSVCTFTETLRGAVEMRRGAIDRAAWQEFVERISFVPASDDGAELAQAVSAAVAELGGARCVFYLAVPPSATESVVRMLGTFDLSGPATVVLEKPFGTDLASAERLNAVLHKVFDDDQIYRIDHFLAKEAVQNILALRFANGLFEPVWNHRHVCYLQIDVPEEIDIQGRADFTESTGRSGT
jgi:glucose-6-phosphate 1-dehydrogenase